MKNINELFGRYFGKALFGRVNEIAIILDTLLVRSYSKYQIFYNYIYIYINAANDRTLSSYDRRSDQWMMNIKKKLHYLVWILNIKYNGPPFRITKMI